MSLREYLTTKEPWIVKKHGHNFTYMAWNSGKYYAVTALGNGVQSTLKVSKEELNNDDN